MEGPVVKDISRHFVERWNSARFQNRNFGLVNSATKTEKKEKKESKKEKPILKRGTALLNESEISSSSDDDMRGSLPMKRSSVFYNAKGLSPSAALSPSNALSSPKGGDIKKAGGTEAVPFQRGLKRKKTFMGKVMKKFKDKPVLCQDIISELDVEGKLNEMEGKHNFTVQALRSVSDWSIGLKETEHSILNAYYYLIENSKHYIYIENQFFVSKAFLDEENDQGIETVVRNQIAYYIRKRIERAYQNKENFRVFICIPLLPGFAGSPTDDTISVILKHTYAGLCRNKGLSIIEKLSAIMGDEYKKYITVFSLRGHAVLNDEPVTELIYIHSKLMIVDDERVILGSANINDRSMMGDRDSEFAVMIQQDCEVNGCLDGKECKVSEYAQGFRKGLMSEHLGLAKNDPVLDDPTSDALWDKFHEIMMKNTLAYRVIFHCYPDNEIKNEEQLRKVENAMKEKDEHLKERYEEKKGDIQGHAVEFPLEFMKDFNLGLSMFSKEGLLPEKNYT
ncbi:MAG: phospholipase D-like domain-containing protein [archaeon]|nr:phospholipase D-like domain-containing protein [archaeon]